MQASGRGLLARLARVLRKVNRGEEARAAYLRLAALGVGSPQARVAGVPAELVARQALCELSGLTADAEALKRDLLQARWQITRGQFQFYWSEASRLAGHSTADPLPAEAAALSEAADQWWRDFNREQSPRGQTTMWASAPGW